MFHYRASHVSTLFYHSRRVVLIVGGYLIFCSFWGSYVYFNAKVTDQNGDEIPVREALYHFLKSPWWTDLKQSLRDVKNYIRAHGWVATWKLMVEMSDTNGENNAYKVITIPLRSYRVIIPASMTLSFTRRAKNFQFLPLRFNTSTYVRRIPDLHVNVAETCRK